MACERLVNITWNERIPAHILEVVTKGVENHGAGHTEFFMDKAVKPFSLSLARTGGVGFCTQERPQTLKSRLSDSFNVVK